MTTANHGAAQTHHFPSNPSPRRFSGERRGSAGNKQASASSLEALDKSVDALDRRSQLETAHNYLTAITEDDENTDEEEEEGDQNKTQLPQTSEIHSLKDPERPPSPDEGICGTPPGLTGSRKRKAP